MLNVSCLSLGIMIAACCSACGASRSAVFHAADGTAITIMLDPSHPVLAEYDRTLTLSTRSSVPATKRMQMDTGGYAAANLYRCADGAYMLDSYGEMILIDAKAGKINDGTCPAGRTYLGIFDGGGNKPWAFIPASQSTERELVMRAG